MKAVRKEKITRIVLPPTNISKTKRAQFHIVVANVCGDKHVRVFTDISSINQEISRLKELRSSIRYLKRVHQRIPK